MIFISALLDRYDITLELPFLWSSFDTAHRLFQQSFPENCSSFVIKLLYKISWWYSTFTVTLKTVFTIIYTDHTSLYHNPLKSLRESFIISTKFINANVKLWFVSENNGKSHFHYSGYLRSSQNHRLFSKLPITVLNRSATKQIIIIILFYVLKYFQISNFKFYFNFISPWNIKKVKGQHELNEKQQRFRNKKSAQNAIFTKTKILEKSIESNKPVYICFMVSKNDFYRIRESDKLNLLEKPNLA